MKTEFHIGRSGKMIKKIKEWFKAEDMLPNGCLPSGHKFAPHGMCTICGEHKIPPQFINRISKFIVYLWNYDPSYAGCPAGKHNYWHKFCKTCGRYK
jgi:hypothetical protein